MLKQLWRRWKASLQPIELKRGSLYVIECTSPMEPGAYDELSGYLEAFQKKTGCEFLVLDHGFKIALNVPHGD